MAENSKAGVWVGWLIGGIPIIASSLRATSALTGTNWVAQIPIAAGISAALQQVLVFQIAQDIAFGQVGLVLSLFLLIFGAWVVLGVLLTGNVRRRLDSANVIAGAAVGIVALSYIVLYFGVYQSLLTQGIPGAQLAVFYIVPVVSAAALFGSYQAYPWEDTQYKRAIQRLSNAEQTAEQKLETYHQMLEQEVGSRNPTGHGVVIDTEFEEAVESVIESAQRFTQAGAASNVHGYDIERIEREADTLTVQADRLDPEAAASEVRETLDTELEQRIETDLVSFSPTTPAGEPIQVQNLPAEYSQITGPGGFTIELSTERADISDQIRDAVASGELSLIDALEFVDTAREHIDSVLEPYGRSHAELLAPHLSDWPSMGDDEPESIEEQLATVRQRIDNIDGDTQIALEHLYVSGDRLDEVVSCAQADRALQDARTAFIEGNFDAIEPKLEEARTIADALLTVADYFGNTLTRALANDASTAPVLPPTATEQPVFTRDAYEAVIPAMQRDYDVSLSLRWAQKSWDIDATAAPGDTTSESTGTASDTDTDAVDTDSGFEDYATDEETENLKYSVKVLVETLREATRNGDDTATIDRSKLPPMIDGAAVAQFREFIDQHDQLVNDSSPDESEIRVTSTADISLGAAGRELLDDYATWAAQPGSLTTRSET